MKAGEERQQNPNSGSSLHGGLNSLFFRVSLSIFDTSSSGPSLSPSRQTDQ